MNRHDRLQSLFLDCVGLAAAERDALLDLRCAGDPALKAEVLDLLRRDAAADTPTLQPVVAHEDPALGIEAPALPETIGGYRIVRRLGEGGFGEVFEAEQEHPVRRRVAVKVLKPGMDTRAVLARFAAERQALALMDHAGVARVLDAGATEAGRPYFAMELVAGEPITDWCDRARASLVTRIELLIAVCRAVEHAHQKGVIHRDLKPTNILVSDVDGRPVPKVIDFGIAKAALAAPEEASLRTRPGEVLGTPEYMSPEQAASDGLDVDTRTDVYSLGVVLYRLVTGKLPFESERLRDASLEDMRRILRDEEPPRPSQRGGDARALRGDLDWIIARAMDKERSRRYASPALLADDLGRHLREEPVHAGPPTLGYRLRKLVRRRRGTVAAGALVTVAIAMGVVATAVQAIRATRAEEDARRQAETAAAVNEFLVGMLGAGNPETNPGAHLVTVREVVERAVAELRDSTFASPAAEAGIRGALASTYVGLGLYQHAAPLAKRALELTERSSAAGATTAIEREVLLAQVESLNGDSEAAEVRLARLAPRVGEAATDPVLRSSFLQVRGGNLASLDRFEAADSMLTASVELRRRQFRRDGSHRSRLASSLTDLSELKGRRGMLAESEALAREAVAVARSSRGDEHHDVAVAIGHLGSVHRRQGRYASAESLYRAAIEIDRRVVGPRHPFVGYTLGNLGLTLSQQGRSREAEVAHREALDIVAASIPGDHPDVVIATSNLATAIQEQGRLHEALDLRLAALAMSRRVHGPTSTPTAIQINNLASLYRLQKRYDAAAPLFLEADSIFVTALGPAHPQAVIARYNLGKILLDQGRARAAEPHLRESARRAAIGLPANHPNAAVVRSTLAHACIALQHTAEAETLLLAAYTDLAKALGPDHERARYAAEGLASVYRGRGRKAEARRWERLAAGATIAGRR